VAYVSVAIIGFWVYLICASAIGWIMPIWWGGEELFFPILITPFIAVNALLVAYVLFQYDNTVPYVIEHIVRLLSFSFVQGVIFYPGISFVALVLQIGGNGYSIAPQFSVIAGLIVNMIFNFVIIYVVKEIVAYREK